MVEMLSNKETVGSECVGEFLFKKKSFSAAWRAATGDVGIHRQFVENHIQTSGTVFVLCFTPGDSASNPELIILIKQLMSNNNCLGLKMKWFELKKNINGIW